MGVGVAPFGQGFRAQQTWYLEGGGGVSRHSHCGHCGYCKAMKFFE